MRHAETRAPTAASWQEREERAQPGHVLLHVRRQLKERGPEPLFQGSSHFEKIGHRLVAVLEALHVRDPLRRLEDELKVGGDLARPGFEHRGLGHAIEGVVDLDRLEPLGVVTQHLLVRQFLRIEAPLPFLVGVAARADLDLHATIVSDRTGTDQAWRLMNGVCVRSRKTTRPKRHQPASLALTTCPIPREQMPFPFRTDKGMIRITSFNLRGVPR